MNSLINNLSQLNTNDTNKTTDIEVNTLINNFKKMDVFSDIDEYMKLHESSLLELPITKNDTLAFLNIVCKNAYNRYIHYLNIIEFTDKSNFIKNDIDTYIKRYNKKSDVYSLYQLFNLMKTIDNNMLNIIHNSKLSSFWIN